MSRLERLFIFCILVLLSASLSCKYEEGPLISFESNDHRIAGYYSVYSFKVDGVEQIDLYIDQCNCNWKFIYDPEREYTANFRMEGCVADQLGGIYRFAGAKEQNLYLELSSSYPNYFYVYWGPLRSISISIWEIEKLTSDELWITTVFDDKEYYVKLKEN
jgi:hypothetical protein